MEETPVTDVLADLTTDQRAAHDRVVAYLHENGWETIAAHDDLTAGVRVRHKAHQYPQAYRDGTGTVAAVTLKDPSSWSVQNGMPDVEIVVVWDEATGLTVSNVAQYHVGAVGVPA